MPTARVAALISGRGSNLKALLEAAARPGYPARFVGVATDIDGAAGLAHAEAHGVATATVARTAHADKRAFEDALDAQLRTWSPELICLAGFMRLLSADFLDGWADRVINIHPSLLPAFRGLDTHKRAIDAGVRVTGCTVHVVRPAMDAGPIIAQAAVPVYASDSPERLADRVLAVEHRLYPHALALIASGRARVEQDRVTLDDKGQWAEPLFCPPLDPA